MTILNTENSLLLIIDVQDKLLNAVFNAGTLEKQSEIMAKAASLLGIPVFITEQYPKGLGGTIPAIKNALSEAFYQEKTAFNAVSDMDFLAALKNSGRKQVLLFGIETHICVHQTASSLIDNGFEVHLVKDACGSRTLDEYINALKYMRDYGVHIKTTEMVLFELLKGAKNPKFKEIQALIK